MNFLLYKKVSLKIKKLLLSAVLLLLTVSMPSGCSAGLKENSTGEAQADWDAGAPKYVFLFIGDGMSYPQFQLAADYQGIAANQNVEDNSGTAAGNVPALLNFMDFPVSGIVSTYNTNSLITDSASSATSILTGHKTYSGILNMDETASVSYKTITEKLHEQLGMRIGIVTSANLNHATPAACYAHQASRHNYYEIGRELIHSGFEYFAGGDLRDRKGADSQQEDLCVLAEKAGYSVVNTQSEAEKVTSGPVIIIDEYLADSSTMAYSLDRTEDMWSLADYVKKGIEVLDNGKGFFLMCESGKIDMACHANDAVSAIHETLVLADAVQIAVDFAKDHADETLILVTGDHETGGMTIGFTGTDYSMYLSLLKDQKISFARYDSDYVSRYKEDGTDFETVLSDIESLFGIKAEGDPKDRQVLTDYERMLLRTAYDKSIGNENTGRDPYEDYLAYGDYEPLTVTITHILNQKAGISFTTYSHTGLPAALFADGVNAQRFSGYYDNTEIYEKLADMLGVK